MTDHSVSFLINIDLLGTCDISTHVGILPNCYACPEGRSPTTCEELCEAYAEELNKLEVGSVGFVQPEPVMDIISANNLRGVDHEQLLTCPSILSVIEDNMIIDERFMSDMNREKILDILQKEIETKGTILTHRQFEVLYLTYVDGLQPAEIAPLLANNDELYNLNNAWDAGNITEEEYYIKKREIETQPKQTVTSQTVIFHLKRAIIKIAKESGLRKEIEPAFKLQKIKCEYTNCNVWFVPIDKNQKFCSIQCRRKHKNRYKNKKKKAQIEINNSPDKIAIICANPKCAAPFVPHDVVQKYCTVRCRKRHYNIKYSITKKKKLKDIFEPVSRTGDVDDFLSINIVIKIK